MACVYLWVCGDVPPTPLQPLLMMRCTAHSRADNTPTFVCLLYACVLLCVCACRYRAVAPCCAALGLDVVLEHLRTNRGTLPRI